MEHHLIVPWKHDALARKWLARAIGWAVLFFIGAGIGNLSTDHGYPDMSDDLARLFARAFVNRLSVAAFCVEPEYIAEEERQPRHFVGEPEWLFDYKAMKPGYRPGYISVKVEESGAAYWEGWQFSDDPKDGFGRRDGLCPEQKDRGMP